MSNLNFVFFGTSEFAVKILEKLIESGYIPNLVVTTPDKPKGRKMILTPPPIKVFAKNNLKIIQPEKLNSKLFQKNRPARTHFAKPSGDHAGRFFFRLRFIHCRFIRQNYSKKRFGNSKVWRAQCSSFPLPKFRGPSPIQSFILSGEEKRE